MWAKQEELTFYTLLQGEWMPHQHHLHKILLWMTASHRGTCGAAPGAPCAGHWLLTPEEGQPVTFSVWAQAASGHRRPKGSSLQGLSYHKFLDSPDQEEGVWSRFRNNRWSTSRDWFWRRALPNPSVRNSRSYFFPLMWTWQPPLLGTFFWSVFICHEWSGHRWLFAEQVLLRPCEAQGETLAKKIKQKPTLNLFPCHIAVPPQTQALEFRSKHSCLQIHKCISLS